MTIHWFFTFGYNPREAEYHLQHAPNESTTRRFVTTALLALGWPVTSDRHAEVVLHCFETPQLADTKPILADELADVAPHVTVSHVMIGKRTEGTIWDVVRHVLDTVQDGDQVVLESTNGLRSITIGVLLAAGMLLSLRRTVTVLAVTYAELPENGVSEIIDLLPFFRLFEWSHAVRTMAGYLDPTPTLQLLGNEAVDLPEQPALRDLGTSLAFNWPIEIDRGLRAWIGVDARADSSGFSVPAVLALAAARQELSSLLEPMSARSGPPTHLDEAHLAFELQLIERLIGAQRYADAARGVREWMVNAVLWSWQLHADWLRTAVRSRAERALHGLSPNGPGRDVRILWDDACRYRNAVSHLRYNARHEITPAELQQYLMNVVPRLRELWNDREHNAFDLPRAVSELQRLIANAFSVNMLASVDRSVTFRRLTLREARAESRGRISVVGHADTAECFAMQLEQPVECHRATVKLDSGDTVLLGQYEGPRLAEGTTTLPEGARITWILVEIQ